MYQGCTLTFLVANFSSTKKKFVAHTGGQLVNVFIGKINLII